MSQGMMNIALQFLLLFLFSVWVHEYIMQQMGVLAEYLLLKERLVQIIAD